MPTVTAATYESIIVVADKLIAGGCRLDHGAIRRAIMAAVAAEESDRLGDCAARDRAVLEIWREVGYWRQSRRLSTAEYRGDVMPPQMLRMPAGRSVDWAHRWQAMRAWAALVD